MKLWLSILLVLPLAAELTRLEQQLVKIQDIQTVYVDELKGEGATQLRDMIIGSVHRTGLFVLTEDETKADAFLRGSAEDLIFTDTTDIRSGINLRGAASNSRREKGESDFSSASFGLGDTNSTDRRERKHEASAAVRLVLRNGEVVWTTTRQSLGAKYLSSGADVADLVAKDLKTAYERAVALSQRSE